MKNDYKNFNIETSGDFVKPARHFLRKICLYILIFLLFVQVIACKRNKKEITPDQTKIKNAQINLRIRDLISKGKAEKDDNQKAKIFGAVSELLLEKGDYKKAVQYARRAKRANPYQEKALYTIAAYYFHNGNYTESQMILASILSRNTNHAKANYLLGNNYMAVKKVEQAITAYQRAVTLNPDNVQAYNNLAVALGHKKKYNQAYKILQKAVKKKPGFALTYKNLGITAESLGKKTDARQYYQKYIDLNPYAEDIEIVSSWMKKL